MSQSNMTTHSNQNAPQSIIELSAAWLIGLATLLIFLAAPLSLADGYDPDPVWPLCGYDSSDATLSTCPDTEWANADIVNDTYGPRLKFGEYDWHFGIDLHAEDQMPVFAVTCGKITKLDENGGLENNKLITLTHFRDWECPEDEDEHSSFPSCTNTDGSSNCYYTVYNHLSEIDSTLVVGDLVLKAQFLGRTGYNTDDYDYDDTDPDDYYEHLHFELLDPSGAGEYQAFAPTSRVQRDAVHPHRLLKQSDWADNADNMTLSLTANVFNPAKPTLTATVIIDTSSVDPDDFELDLNRIEAEVYDASNPAKLKRIMQFHNAYAGAYAALPTPERTSSGRRVTYDVHPPYLDMERWVRQYSYADSTSLPYRIFMSKFGSYTTGATTPTNGRYVSPFSLQTIDGAINPVYDSSLDVSTYEWGYHLHVQDASDAAKSDFNGLHIEAEDFNRDSTEYQLTVRMDSLLGSSSASALCIKVRAEDIYGNTTPWQTAGTCGSSFPGFP